jgi:hypothetical protein
VGLLGDRQTLMAQDAKRRYCRTDLGPRPIHFSPVVNSYTPTGRTDLTEDSACFVCSTCLPASFRPKKLMKTCSDLAFGRNPKRTEGLAKCPAPSAK